MPTNLCCTCRIIIASFLSGQTDNWARCVIRPTSTAQLCNTCSSWRHLLKNTMQLMQRIPRWQKLTNETIESYLVGKCAWPLSSIKPKALQLGPMSGTCTTWHALAKDTLKIFRIRNGYYTDIQRILGDDYEGRRGWDTELGIIDTSIQLLFITDRENFFFK